MKSMNANAIVLASHIAIIIAALMVAVIVRKCDQRTDSRSYMQAMSTYYAHCEKIGWQGKDCEE